MSLRLIAVHAHPDDESSKGAATYAHYVENGCEVLVVSCTGGEMGDILNSDIEVLPAAHRDLAGLRRKEMTRAKNILGLQHTWLGYRDSGLPPENEPVKPMSFADVPIEISAEALVRVVREFKPHVMITYNEMGGYPHPDHIRCHEISMRAWQVAGDASVYPEAGPAWQMQKLYYEEIFNADRFMGLRDELQRTEPASPMLERLNDFIAFAAKRERKITTRVHVADFFERRDQALRAHASQVAPDDSFFFWPNDLQQKAWPSEDYRLAATHFAGTNKTENKVYTQQDWLSEYEVDLFAGVDEDFGAV